MACGTICRNPAIALWSTAGGPELDYDYEYAHEHEFGVLCVAYGGRLPCGQLNVTVFQAFVNATVRENLSPTDAARLIRRGESDSVRTAG